MAKILIIHGPNLNLLGTREPNHYGSDRLEDINNLIIQQAAEWDHAITTFQSNAEYQLIERIQQAPHEKTDFIIMNPAAFTHTSIALRDTLLAVAIPFIEVHLSNIMARESFRQHSYFSDIAIGTISGFGATSYKLALLAADNYLNHTKRGSDGHQKNKKTD
ncbi:MAG: type II 3-dehydroquinate dehydratase [Gammaproteobacteria bacterium]|nr:type II 3-dehydroquinate dehydratase [Gammaproteobacteria bacterium]